MAKSDAQRQREYKARANKRNRCHGATSRMVWNGRVRARRKGIEFSITTRDLKIPASCPVLGIPLVCGGAGGTDNSPSLDRVDTAKGYVRGNVAVISYLANRIKNDASAAQVLRVAEWMKTVGL